MLNAPIAKLLESYRDALVSGRKRYTPIHVDETASRVAKLYETIRKVIDWKDDNALRRGAIERILKRRLFSKIAGFEIVAVAPEQLAESVAMELVRGGHLPNNQIPQDRVRVLSEALKKYLLFLEQNTVKSNILDVKEKINYATFVVEIAACEIEEILRDPVKEYGLIGAMTDLLEERIDVIPSDRITAADKRKSIFVAVCRNLYGLDDNFISYHLLRSRFPDWESTDKEKLLHISKSINSARKEIGEDLENPINGKFDPIAERIDTVFLLLGDVLDKLKEKPEEIVKTIEDKEKFRILIREAYDSRYQTLRKRLFRLAIFSTLSVFLSNWVTFYIVEVPLAKIFYEGFNFLAAAVDFLVPTALMYLMVSIIRPPKESNAKRVMEETFSFVYEDEASTGYEINFGRRSSSLSRAIFSAMYLLTAALVFWGIAYVFYIAKLPITSVIFDTFTIALTVFAAVTIANKARELSVEEHSGFKDFLVDSISVPVAKVGYILSAKWKEYNIVAIFFTFLVETPFALVLNFVQDWSEYIKEKRSEFR